MKKLTTKQILKNNQAKTSPLNDNFILWLHNIRSMHNVGAAFRCADAFGVKELWLSGYTPVPPRPEITKTAIGAEEHVSWKKVTSITDGIGQLRQDGYRIVGLEQTSRSQLIQNFNPGNQPLCLVLGNEVSGIDESLLAVLDDTVEIPQFGMKHSLNVSVAAGIALYAFLEKSQISL
ncbi:MAG: TrmH family RNA methyltransferase [Balneolaceae bacterium]|nr:MAG: TrmH family RNA methyltransferase [Balneolaceae bacterium]